jgi:hypothetical protein
LWRTGKFDDVDVDEMSVGHGTNNSEKELVEGSGGRAMVMEVMEE